MLSIIFQMFFFLEPSFLKHVQIQRGILIIFILYYTLKKPLGTSALYITFLIQRNNKPTF